MKPIPIKTDSELATMREAGRRAAQVLGQVAGLIRVGVSTQELDDFAKMAMGLAGVRSAFLDYHGYPAQCCISVNEQVIHGIPGPYRIKEGDVVSVDVGIWHEGFVGDNAVTVAVGEVSEDVQRLLTGTRLALVAGISAARAGARLGDISNAVEKVARAHRLGIVDEYVGHGVGRALHEEPQIPNFGPAGRGPVLRPGMVLCIEPMLNLGTKGVRLLDDGWTVVTKDRKPSAHFEHMVAITPDTPEVLTPRPDYNVAQVF
ncbi:MAG: type I methionyl aminopeptidase [Kiritimatiellaeota bacterium]|nr:type I methionyl aminopeptidase [Kiritimatiellota bacterium]